MALILNGDCRDILPTLPERSVHCVVTSPPYWGLRDYGTASWDGGDAECGHVQRTNAHGGTSNRPGLEAQTYGYRDTCRKCGARRIDRQLGLEPTPEEYVANMVAVFREVRRVLRDDGTVWLNLGDSYASGEIGRHDGRVDGSGYGARHPGPRQQQRLATGLKPKDLVGIPWRVAFALQADGWYLRSDIIWSKPNPMPESVTDRPTKAHEYVFLLSKRERYYFDQEAVREAPTPQSVEWNKYRHPRNGASPHASHGSSQDEGRIQTDPSGRNIRSVWSIATQPYPGAHFAVFPEALVEPCIKAGTSERGVCPECGAPWERVVERETSIPARIGGPKTAGAHIHNDPKRPGGYYPDAPQTTGWRPSCAHDAEPVPATVLDPFGGSGTVGRVAERLSRRSILIELSASYVALAEERTAQIGLML